VAYITKTAYRRTKIVTEYRQPGGDGDNTVGMGTKYFTVSSSKRHGSTCLTYIFVKLRQWSLAFAVTDDVC